MAKGYLSAAKAASRLKEGLAPVPRAPETADIFFLGFP